MSLHVLAEVRIGELDQFLAVFGGEGLAKRAEHGCLGTSVFAPVGETGRVLVLLEFPDQAAADAFRSDPTAPPIMRKGGAQGPPAFTDLEQVGSFDH